MMGDATYNSELPDMSIKRLSQSFLKETNCFLHNEISGILLKSLDDTHGPTCSSLGRRANLGMVRQ